MLVCVIFAIVHFILCKIFSYNLQLWQQQHVIKSQIIFIIYNTEEEVKLFADTLVEAVDALS